MNLKSLTAAEFKSIYRLLVKKEALLARVAKIDTLLGEHERMESAAPANAKPSRKPGRPGKVRAAKEPKRRALKAAILNLLAKAGKTGVRIKDIAKKLGVKPTNIYGWFGSTGKKVKEIKKISPGRYAWVGADVPF